MKEITRVHLAKTPYDIEVEAKKALEKYLADIERAMKSEEAMYEIEARMVELLGERGVKKDGVITAGDVADLRAKMGEPKEFSEDGEVDPSTDSADSSDGAGSAAAAEKSKKPIKRLMRDTDHAVFGGVCAGIAAYFGINPLWIRILFIISPFISFGTTLLIYIVMWISLPEAQTAAEKLQMRGEEVTFDGLKNFSVSDETAKKTKTVAVKVLQIFVAFVMFCTTLTLVIMLVTGSLLGVTAVSWLGGLTAQPWAWGLLASLIVSGAVAVTISGVLTVSSIRWKFGRSSLIAVIIAAVIGAIVLPAIAMTATQMAVNFQRDEERLAKTEAIELPADLTGVKYYRVEGLLSADFSSARSSSDDKIRAELKYFTVDGNKKPNIKVEKQGDTLVVKDESDSSCRAGVLPLLFSVDSCILKKAYVKFYGPIQPKVVETHDYYDESPYRHIRRAH